MLRFTFRQLEYFVAVGETGSIARASERLNVSSPSISTAIGQLEQEFGRPLFVRHHAQGLSLTQTGQQMLAQAKSVLQGASGLVDLAADIAGRVHGPLSVGCLVTFAQVVLPALRRSFQAEHPTVNVRQAELNQMEIFSALRRAEIDVALTYDLDLPADLQFEGLVELPPFVMVGEDHPLRNRSSVAVTDLADRPMVLLDLPHSADYFLSFFRSVGFTPEIAERTQDIAVMRSLVGNGFGYAIANLRPLNDLSPDGKRLTFIPLEGDLRPTRLGLLTAQDAHNANTVRAFLDHCETHITSASIPVVRHTH